MGPIDPARGFYFSPSRLDMHHECVERQKIAKWRPEVFSRKGFREGEVALAFRNRGEGDSLT